MLRTDLFIQLNVQSDTIYFGNKRHKKLLNWKCFRGLECRQMYGPTTHDREVNNDGSDSNRWAERSLNTLIR